jgi:hypothetical protein
MIDPELYYRVWQREHDELVKSAARRAAAAGAPSKGGLSRLVRRLWKAARPAARGAAGAPGAPRPAPVRVLASPSSPRRHDLPPSANSRR